jgi:hypothetical protein
MITCYRGSAFFRLGAFHLSLMQQIQQKDEFAKLIKAARQQKESNN